MVEPTIKNSEKEKKADRSRKEPKVDLKRLKQAYDALTEERDDLVAKLQRARADLQNYQKRAARERAELCQQVQVDTIERFLFPVIDDLERAIEAANEHGYTQDDPLFSGLAMVHQRMFELLKQYGIEVIEAHGKPFDPLYHQAVMEQPTEEHADGTILQVVSRGYVADGKTIRPARVVVAKRPQEQQAAEEEQHGDDDE